jgi:hypothetical protein
MSAVITLEPSATLRGIETLREQLLESFAEHSSIEIDASALAEIDLSFLQLVEAARIHAANEDKTVRLTRSANPALKALLDRAGFLTAPTADDLEFWFHGDLPQ